MRVREQGPGPLPERSRPTGRFVMLLTGLIIGIVLATGVGVVVLGLRLATVGAAEEIIEAPTPTATATATTAAPEETSTAATVAPTSAAQETSTAAAGGDVPEPCVRSAEYNIAVDESLDELAVGARDEDARAIQEALDAIQDARATADGAAEECLELSSRNGTP